MLKIYLKSLKVSLMTFFLVVCEHRIFAGFQINCQTKLFFLSFCSPIFGNALKQIMKSNFTKTHAWTRQEFNCEGLPSLNLNTVLINRINNRLFEYIKEQDLNIYKLNGGRF